MNGFTVTEFNTDVEHLNTSVVGIIERTLIDLSTKKDKIVLGLCGGRSVGAIFELLSRNENIPWNKVHFFMVDERLVSIDDLDSNYRLVHDILINPLKAKGLITDANCHPFILNRSKPHFGVDDYSEEFKSFGGKFDLLLLSGGEDGHIGAIYPNHHSFDDESEYFMYMTDSPKPPEERMSASKKLVLKSDAAILLVIGESKKDLIWRLSSAHVRTSECPAKLVTQIPTSYLVTTHKA